MSNVVAIGTCGFYQKFLKNFDVTKMKPGFPWETIQGKLSAEEKITHLILEMNSSFWVDFMVWCNSLEEKPFILIYSRNARKDFFVPIQDEKVFYVDILIEETIKEFLLF